MELFMGIYFKRFMRIYFNIGIYFNKLKLGRAYHKT